MPELVVAKKSEFNKVDHPIEEWLLEVYEPVVSPIGVERYIFLVPKAGESI